MEIIPIKEIVSDFDGVQIHQGIDHLKDRIYIHLDLTTMCNYDCSYCCNRAEYKHWQKPGSFNKIMEFFDDLEVSKNQHNIPIFLMFTGGEPTLAIKYFSIVDRARELLTHKDDRLILESNGSRNMEFFEKYPIIENDNVYHMFSIHPEHITEDSDKSTELSNILIVNYLNNYIHKLKILIAKGYKVKVNLMMMHSERYYRFLEMAYTTLKYHDIEVHPHFIYHKSEYNPIKYPKKFWDRFGEILSNGRKDYEQDGKQYSDFEIFKEQRNVFTGWTCYHNNITVNIDGIISNQCFDIDSIDDVFQLMKGKTCTYKSCNCDGLLKIRKII